MAYIELGDIAYSLINNDSAYEVIGYEGTPSEVVIPATRYDLPVTGIRAEAFWGCQSLTSIELPDSITSIGNYAFDDCPALTSINIPDGVTSIGMRTFSGCSSLTSIELPDSITSIGNYAFDDCDSLTSIVIPDSVISIGDSAFYGCRSLTSVTIPNSVTRIGNRTFSNCPNLKSIILLRKIPSPINSNSFEYLPESSKFYCFSSAIESYKTATNWKAHAAKFVADDLGLYFAMSAAAQRKYFATQEEVKKLKAELSELRAAGLGGAE